MTNRDRDQVFISYSHNDQKWLEQIENTLKPLMRNRTIDVWADTRIAPGQDWRDEIRKALARANVAVLLVTQDFLASDFIANDELPPILAAAEADGLTIIWVPVSASLYEETAIVAFQAAHDPKRPLDTLTKAKRKAALVAIAKKIRDAAKLQIKEPPIVSAGSSRPAGSIISISIGHLPAAGEFLVSREQELARLHAAWQNPKEHVISVVARGGEGKTNLVTHWLNDMAANEWNGAERVFGWSFFSQGVSDKAASADAFIDEALRFFGVAQPETIASSHERGERLAQLVGASRNLLVLDGLEPLQYPPGPMFARLKDPALQTLLSGLASQNRGLCVITTREALPELAGGKNNVSPEIELPPLTPTAGALLFARIGVHGSTAEKEAAATRLGGHALSILLAGTYLVEVCRGDVRRADEAKLLDQDEASGSHAHAVLKSYENWFSGAMVGDDEIDPANRSVSVLTGLRMLTLLRLLGLFDRPADMKLIDVLRAPPPIEGLTEPLTELSDTDFERAVARLRELRLVTDESGGYAQRTLDCHPLVREYFSAQLRERFAGAAREGHRRLYGHLTMAAPELPANIRDMMPLFEAVVHGCKAGLYWEALNDVYLKRIKRGKEQFNFRKLGAVGISLASLSAFFRVPWRTLVTDDLGAGSGGFLFSEVALFLWSMGRTSETIGPMTMSFERAVAEGAWQNAATAAVNLSEVSGTLGDMATALRLVTQSVEYADRSESIFVRMANRASVGDALNNAGRPREALQAFLDAERIQQEKSKFPFIYSVPGARFCDLLLEVFRLLRRDKDESSTTYLDAVRQRVEATLHLHTSTAVSGTLNEALDRLTLAKVFSLNAELTLDAGDKAAANALFSAAAEEVDRAVTLLRDASFQEEIARGLVTRAGIWTAFLRAGRSDREYASLAGRDLTEAEQIAARGGMMKWQIEATIQRAELFMVRAASDASARASAKEKLQEARQLIQQTEAPFEPYTPDRKEWEAPAYTQVFAKGDPVGYHRRDTDIAVFEQTLALTTAAT